MKFKKYYKYFRLIWQRWDLKTALFSVYTEVKGEYKYGIQSTAFYDPSILQISSQNRIFSNAYQPANYRILEKAFRYLRHIKPDGHFIDFGCGMGRILAVAAHFGYQSITGVEFAKNLCLIAEENMKGIRKEFPQADIQIYCADASEYPIKADQNIFCFFNPFHEQVMIQVIKNIKLSLKDHPRRAYILYFTPVDRDIILSAGFEEIWHYEMMNYVDFSIFNWIPEEEFSEDE